MASLLTFFSPVYLYFFRLYIFSNFTLGGPIMNISLNLASWMTPLMKPFIGPTKPPAQAAPFSYIHIEKIYIFGSAVAATV